jgi:hypothetical protein
MSLIYEHIGLITLTLSLIHVFYFAFKTSWPQLYFSTSDQFSFYISTTPQRYVAFRLLPVFIIISVLFGVEHIPTVYEAGFLGLFVGIVHSVLTNLVALLKIIFNSKSVAMFRNRPSQVLIHIVSIVCVSILGAIAGIFSTTTLVNAIIPTQQGLTDNIWSSLLTALFAISFYRIYESNKISEDIVFQNTLETIPTELIKYIDEYSLKNNADSNLIKAVAIIESLERPSWFRKLEYFKSYLIKKGSYGIMQVTSDNYIDDKQSVKLSIDKHFKNHPKISSGEDIDKIVRSYNKNNKYIDLVTRAYNHLTPINF